MTGPCNPTVRPVSRLRRLTRRLQRQETLNFWLTNRIPRNLLTRWMGAFSRIENRTLARISISIWRRFADDLRLEEAAEPEFASLHACFTRRLRPGARPIDRRPDVLVSPVDAVVGAHGEIGRGDIGRGELLQAKGMVYRLDALLDDARLARAHGGGRYVTLRLKSSMYHRFHAPCDGRVRRVDRIAGEVYNVNPPALKRIPGLFCRNERAVIRCDCEAGALTLVPVAAVLVASLHLEFLPEPLRRLGNRRFRAPTRIDCDAPFRRGDELGHFEHGSTMIVLTGPGVGFAPGLEAGRVIRMGQPLFVARR